MPTDEHGVTRCRPDEEPIPAGYRYRPVDFTNPRNKRLADSIRARAELAAMLKAGRERQEVFRRLRS